ncbi:MAG: rhamnulokinase [Bacteroidetes bacterium]|nr:rhamnulokinase [Bacteroidota bacterium]
MEIQKEDFKCIAVDMGAGSIRVMLGVIDKEGISFGEVHRITNQIVEIDGHDRWDMEQITSEIRKGIAKAVKLSNETPISIGVDSWGVDFVHLNDQGELLETPVAYRDSRTEGMMEQWKSMMPELETFQRSGINFYIFNTLFQLLALKESPLLTITSRILFIPSYINYLLSGKLHNELTIASTSQMLEVGGDRWVPKILDSLNLAEGVLGDVIAPGSLLGPVVIPEAEGTGMESIAVCGHDTACVVAAIPVEDPNYAYISAGTWCIVGIESETPLISDEALKLGITNERGYGNTYRSLKNIVGLWLLQGLKKHLPENTSFSEMEAMTREGGTIMHVIDPDDPGFYNPEDMKEAFDHYFSKTGQSAPDNFGGYLLCAYDSLCFSFRYHVERLEQLSGRPIEVLHLVGGGSQSDYLNQRIATICRRKVVSGPVEGATLGNIIIQAIAMGRIRDLEEGRRLVKQCSPLKSFLPGEESSNTAERYELYMKLKQS